MSDGIPALMAGNAVVIKPDAQTMLTALLGARLLEESGFPRDLWQVVAGPGSEVGGALVRQADYVCFTGSTATGRIIARGCAERLIGCSLELGGKNPILVLRDADVERAAEGAVRASFSNAGQLCVSSERMFVADQVYDRFVDRFVSRTEAMTLGATLDWGNDMGPLISEQQLTTVQAHVDDAVAKGARVLTGGRARPELAPYFFEPTILEGVTPDMACFGTETFGPVVAVYRFHDEADAVARANEGEYGLNGSIYSQDGARARAIAREIKCGTVNVNEGYGATFGSVDAPMGGMRQSGLGRRHGPEGHPPLHRHPVGRHPAPGPHRPDARDVRRGLREADDGQPAPDEEARPSCAGLDTPLVPRGGSTPTGRAGDVIGVSIRRSSLAAARPPTGAPVTSSLVEPPEPLGEGVSSPGDHDFDVLVVGSGFGGSVTALRLTEKGYRVGVLEAGRAVRRRRLRDDVVARPSGSCSGPELGCYGIQRIDAAQGRA